MDKYTVELEKAYRIEGFKELFEELKQHVPLIQLYRKLKYKEQLREALIKTDPIATKIFQILKNHPEIDPKYLDLAS